MQIRQRLAGRPFFLLLLLYLPILSGFEETDLLDTNHDTTQRCSATVLNSYT